MLSLSSYFSNLRADLFGQDTVRNTLQRRWQPTSRITPSLLVGQSGELADPFSRVAVAFVLGISSTLLQAQLLPIDLLLYILVSLILLLLYARRGNRLQIAVPFLVLVSAAVIGLMWATVAFKAHLDQQFPAEVERQSIFLEGAVIGLPISKNGNTKFRFIVTDSSVSELLGNRIELGCYTCPLEIHAGQTWQFNARLKRPHGYASWGAFDFEKYLFRHQIMARGYLKLSEPATLLASSASTVDHHRALMKQRLHALSLSSPVGAAIIAALAIGDKSLLSQTQRDVLQATGVSHLMAISGLHIGLVFVFVKLLCGYLLFPFARLFNYVPRQHIVLAPALASAIAYAALAGFAVSTQRAILMLSVYVICRLLLRDVSLFKILLTAAGLILIVDPFSIFDAGFWLSCGAVLVISLVSSGQSAMSLLKLQPRLWLGMLPLTALIFGQVSIVSPIVNLVMVPLFCVILIPATLLGVALLELGFVTLAASLLEVLALVYQFIFNALTWLASMPLARIHTVQWSGWHYCALLAVVFTLRSRLWIRFATCGLFCGLLIYSPANRLTDTDLEVTLLDVGQGLAMVVRTSESVLVYDTGPRYRSGFSAADAVLLPYLRSRGVHKIDTLIISHADNDHIGGLHSVLNAFPVGKILTSRIDKVPQATLCEKGQEWRSVNSQFRILGPQSSTPPGSNNLSCVLQIVHGDTTILITGDIEKQVERHLLQTGADLSADIMLVPHQGSKTSSTAAFIDAVDPRLAMVAAGYLNHYGHPHPSVVERYTERAIQLASTNDHGTIVLKIDLQGWRAEAYRVDQKRFWHHQKMPNYGG